MKQSSVENASQCIFEKGGTDGADKRLSLTARNGGDMLGGFRIA